MFKNGEEVLRRPTYDSKGKVYKFFFTEVYLKLYSVYRINHINKNTYYFYSPTLKQHLTWIMCIINAKYQIKKKVTLKKNQEIIRKKRRPEQFWRPLKCGENLYVCIMNLLFCYQIYFDDTQSELNMWMNTLFMKFMMWVVCLLCKCYLIIFEVMGR